MGCKRDAYEELMGNKYGMLTVIDRPEKGTIKVKCLCDCGKVHFVSKHKLLTGSTKSCGCNRLKAMSEAALLKASQPGYVNGSKSHGLSRTPTYTKWQAMKERCKGCCEFTDHYYKDVGISYDPRWEIFENFLEDMGLCPDGLSLDRIDPKGNYCKENCRWVGLSEQSFNTRKQVNNTSGRTGVVWSKSRNKWIARMNINKKQTVLGAFLTFEEACLCREKAELEMYGYTKE